MTSVSYEIKYPHVYRAVCRAAKNRSQPEVSFEDMFVTCLLAYCDNLHEHLSRKGNPPERSSLFTLEDASITFPGVDVRKIMLFNHSVLNMMVCKDPLVMQVNDFLRSTQARQAEQSRGRQEPGKLRLLAFSDLVKQYLTWCRAQPTRTHSYALLSKPLNVMLKLNKKLRRYRFPRAAFWAAFVANKSEWCQLYEAPEFKLEDLYVGLTLPEVKHVAWADEAGSDYSEEG